MPLRFLDPNFHFSIGSVERYLLLDPMLFCILESILPVAFLGPNLAGVPWNNIIKQRMNQMPPDIPVALNVRQC
ncbi:MAG: hypothetical protein Q4D15_01860, partial [Lachnospiraceae bacterium]|nr:hypothetical protein [Lachnospiraceae bacterium]